MDKKKYILYAYCRQQNENRIAKKKKKIKHDYGKKLDLSCINLITFLFN